MIQHKLTENYLREGETHSILYFLFFFPPLSFPPHPRRGRGKRGDIGTSATDSHGCVWQRLCSFLAGPSPRPQRWGPGYPVSREFFIPAPGTRAATKAKRTQYLPIFQEMTTETEGSESLFWHGQIANLFKFFSKRGKKAGKNPPELAAPHVLVEMLQTWLPLTSAT